MPIVYLWPEAINIHRRLLWSRKENRYLKKRNFKACASGWPVVVELRPKSSKEKEISGFLNERSLDFQNLFEEANNFRSITFAHVC
jgi:hypothetical protein